jgi:ubiquinone biosynthesis protein
LAKELIQALLKQIVDDGFFHADLHPGNLLITDDGRAVLMDFGMMGRLDERSRDQLIGLLIKGLRKDVDSLTDTLIQMGATDLPVDRSGLQREIFYLIDKHYYRSLSQIHVGEVLQQIIRISLKYHITIPRELLAVSRSVILLESLVERLDPEIN